MTDHQKIYRVFKLIQYLSQPPFRKVPQLAALLDTTPRTIYRYLETLEAIGYQIDKKPGDRYFIHLDLPSNQNLFDSEEAGYLNELLWNSGTGDPRREKILHKLNQQYALLPIAQSTAKIKAYEHIRMLKSALMAERRVRLHNYLNGDGNLSNRYGEPIEFLDGFTYIRLHDLEKDECRQFKIDRIGDVEVLDEPIVGKHDSKAVDLFGWTGPKWLPVKLRLSPRAHQLLIEEYPDSRPFVRSSGNEAVFDGMVRDWRGIGRFILGLAGEIEVVEPEELRVYLRDRVEQAGW